MKTLNSNTKPLGESLRKIFYSYVRSQGFELDKRWQSVFVVFSRFSEKAVHVFEIHWDKCHRPKFIINFSEASLHGVEFGAKWLNAKDLAPLHCGTFSRLMRSRGSFGNRWIQPRLPFIHPLFSLKRNDEPDEIATRVLDRCMRLKTGGLTRSLANMSRASRLINCEITMTADMILKTILLSNCTQSKVIHFSAT